MNRWCHRKLPVRRGCCPHRFTTRGDRPFATVHSRVTDANYGNSGEEKLFVQISPDNRELSVWELRFRIIQIACFGPFKHHPVLRMEYLFEYNIREFRYARTFHTGLNLVHLLFTAGHYLIRCGVGTMSMTLFVVVVVPAGGGTSREWWLVGSESIQQFLVDGALHFVAALS